MWLDGKGRGWCASIQKGVEVQCQVIHQANVMGGAPLPPLQQKKEWGCLNRGDRPVPLAKRQIRTPSKI